LGLILCADKNQEQIELLELDQGTVRVASDLTQLPPRALLERKLSEAIERARERVVEIEGADGYSADLGARDIDPELGIDPALR